MSIPDWYREKRRSLEEVCAQREEVPEATHLSPSGRFRLAIFKLPDKEGKSWSCSFGRVFDGDGLIAEVRRNYGHFPFAWIEPHPANGQTYLICGEDYQGQTVINCYTGERSDFIEPRAEQGWGFCWTNVRPNPIDQSLLAVSGCYWGCPYELRLVRLHTDRRLEDLARFEDEESSEWVDGGRALNIKREIEIVKSTGKPTSELTEDEREAHEARFATYQALSDAEKAELGKTPGKLEDLLDEAYKIVEERETVEHFIQVAR